MIRDRDRDQSREKENGKRATGTGVRYREQERAAETAEWGSETGNGTVTEARVSGNKLGNGQPIF